MRFAGASSRNQQISQRNQPQSHPPPNPEFEDPLVRLTNLTGDTISNSESEFERLRKLDHHELRREMANNMETDSTGIETLPDIWAMKAYCLVVAKSCAENFSSKRAYHERLISLYYLLHRVSNDDPKAAILALALRLAAENPRITQPSILSRIKSKAEGFKDVRNGEVCRHVEHAIKAVEQKLRPTSDEIAFQARTAPMPTFSGPSVQGPHDNNYNLDPFEQMVDAFQREEHDYAGI